MKVGEPRTKLDSSADRLTHCSDRSRPLTPIYASVTVPLTSRPAGETDLALMAAVAEKNADAQRVVVNRLAGRVARVTALLCGSRADADDAAQLSLIEILTSAKAFRRDTSLEGWADRITARTALRQIRRERQHQGYLLRWVPPGWLPWGRVPREAAGDRFTLEELLSRLSPARREVFVLRHALGFSVQEIGEITGTSKGTIKDRLVASRKQLRRLLEREARRHGRGGKP